MAPCVSSKLRRKRGGTRWLTLTVRSWCSIACHSWWAVRRAKEGICACCCRFRRGWRVLFGVSDGRTALNGCAWAGRSASTGSLLASKKRFQCRLRLLLHPVVLVRFHLWSDRSGGSRVRRSIDCASWQNGVGAEDAKSAGSPFDRSFGDQGRSAGRCVLPLIDYRLGRSWRAGGEREGSQGRGRGRGRGEDCREGDDGGEAVRGGSGYNRDRNELRSF